MNYVVGEGIGRKLVFRPVAFWVPKKFWSINPPLLYQELVNAHVTGCVVCRIIYIFNVSPLADIGFIPDCLDTISDKRLVTGLIVINVFNNSGPVGPVGVV